MLLILGILLWSAVHLSKAMTPGVRAGVVARIGEMPYKGLFSLLIVASLVLIVIGWRAMPVSYLYVPPTGLRHLTMLLVPIAVILFISARAPTDIKQFIRHPQLTGVKLWAFAHLLSNGETRSLILFGGLLAWAVLEVIFINRRDGARTKPAKVGMAKTAITVVIGLVLSAALVWGHGYFTGMPLIAHG